MDKIKFGVYSIMNKKILTLGLVLALVLTFNCKKDKNDDEDMALLALLYVNDQMSGNCAQVSKSGTTYTANLSVIPKGGCSVPQTRAAALETMRSFYDKIIAVYVKAGSTCDSTALSTTATKNALTETSASGSATEEAYQTAIENRRAVSVGSLVTEAALTLTASGYDVTKVKPGSLDQYTLLNASSSGTTDCKAAVKALDTAFFEGYPAKTIVLMSSCKYGTGSTGTDRCATLNEAF